MNMTNEFIEKAMKSAPIKPVLGAIAMALLLSTTGCTAMTGETAGQYVDDSTITAALKAKLLADKAANLNSSRCRLDQASRFAERYRRIG